MLHAGPSVALNDQAEAEVVRRNPDRAAAGPGVAYEVGDIGAVLSFDDPHSAIGVLRRKIAGGGEHVAHEAGACPFPDISADVLQTVFIGTEAAEDARADVGRSAIRFALVTGSSASTDRFRRSRRRRP